MILCEAAEHVLTIRSYYYRNVTDPTSKLKIVIDSSVNEEEGDHGVIVGEGDGTVPLLSSGYMCSKGWKMKRYNPAGIPIKTVEFAHEPDLFDIRYVFAPPLALKPVSDSATAAVLTQQTTWISLDGPT